MNKEKLTCDNCKTEWERISSRGRKPKLCPSCASDSAPVLVQKPAKQPEIVIVDSSTKYPGPSKWKCPNCETKMNTEVGLLDAPVHKCPKRAMRVIVLELVG
jgi:Zn finger protein HypA/HybF involved in hydrogenase expression